jgi:2-oxo-3-hexenedioate decarboxylase
LAEAPAPEPLARALAAALDARRQLPPPGLDPATGYRVAAALARLRAAPGARLVGRKIGFTNRALWPAQGADAPIWGRMWRDTVAPAARGAAVGALLEPRIEPEIVLRLGAPPPPGADAEALFACVEAAALGFELVETPFPGWRVGPGDAIAAGGLHAALRHGPFAPIPPAERGRWRDRLANFRLALDCDGAAAAEGDAAAVMDEGPLAALAALVALLAADPEASPLAAGELVSTGALTLAPPVAPGETWTARAEGLPLPPLALRLR